MRGARSRRHRQEPVAPPVAAETIDPLVVRDLAIDVPGRRLFDPLSFSVPAGRCLALVAPSGAGKTSLINCIAGLRAPGTGQLLVSGEDPWQMPAPRRARLRLERIGMVFQFGELIPELSALENVALPLRLLGEDGPESSARALALLERFGVAGQAGRFPATLSGGEVQRVGLARSLVHAPPLVLADEPTGALDVARTRDVADLLVSVARSTGTAVVVATHDPLVTERMDAVLDLRSSRIDGHG
jgi:ABC-type lipoprotein export system ATPase subunit